jgi:type II secretory pathway pseudopilin PulG
MPPNIGTDIKDIMVLRASFSHKAALDNKGSVLIALIITLVILSALGAVMLSLFSSSTFSHVAAYFNTRAAYLAESGYRYVAGRYKNAERGVAKNEELESLHGRTFTLLDNGGQFTLNIFPCYYNAVVGDKGSDALVVRFPGGKPRWFSIPASGTLAVFGSGKYNCYDYTDFTGNGDYTFNLSNFLKEAVDTGTSVVPVCYPSGAQTVSRGESLMLDTDASNVFPPRFGVFDIVNTNATGDIDHVYFYSERSNNTLTNISVLGNPDKTFSFTVNADPANPDTPIIVHTCVTISSTGTVGSGDMAVSNTFTRTAPLGFQRGGNSRYVNDEDIIFNDPCDSLDNWSEQSGIALLKNPDQDPAINLQGYEVVIGLDWQNPETGIPNLADARSQSNDLLSYELQLKVTMDSQGSHGKHYMAGISFRLDAGADSSYGISFFRSMGRDSNPPDWINNLPFSFDDLMDRDKEVVYLVLWVKDSGSYTLLNYNKLVDSVHSNRVIDSDGSLKDWSTMVVKVEEFYDMDDQRKNRIWAWVEDDETYTRGEAITWNWEEAGDFEKFEWYLNGSNPIVDGTLTSENFNLLNPHEIGLHSYYDSPASNENCFDDFSMKLETNGKLPPPEPVPGL